MKEKMAPPKTRICLGIGLALLGAFLFDRVVREVMTGRLELGLAAEYTLALNNETVLFVLVSGVFLVVCLWVALIGIWGAIKAIRDFAKSE